MSFIANAKYTTVSGRRSACGIFASVALLATLIGTGAPANAQVIFAVSGNNPTAEGTSISATHIVADGWSQTQDYVGVSISASLKTVSVPNAMGNAYLTTRIGQGTTASDEVASTTFLFPADFTEVPLFSDLTLAAGTYYLTVSLASGDLAGWQAIPEADVVLTVDDGVSQEPPPPGVGFYFAINPHVYAPASSFAFEQDRHPVFTVTAVPEPSTLMLVGGPMIYLIARRRRSAECSRA